jgi:hypothetical protein
MPAVDYLFDSAGDWIAFRKGRFVYLPDGAWLGWIGDKEQDVFDMDGVYVGAIVKGDRLFRSQWSAPPDNLNHPGYPGSLPAPEHPGYPGRKDAPDGMEDVALLAHA